MSESIPRAKQEQPPAKEVLDTQETQAYLLSHGVVPLRNFVANTPLLYVFPEHLRSDSGSLGTLYGSRRPSFARLHTPTSLDAVSELASEKGEYGLANEDGGRVDYYAIDAVSEKIELIRTSHSVMQKETPYVVRLEQLFEDKPELFEEGSST